MLAVIVKVMDM